MSVGYSFIYESQPCFKELDEIPKGVTKVSIDVPYLPRSLIATYLSWLFNESYMSTYFITKDYMDIPKGILLRVGCDTLKAAQAVRYIQDGYNIIDMWCRLSMHLQPNPAFILAHYASKLSEEEFIFSKMSINNHTVVQPHDKHPSFPTSARRIKSMQDIAGILQDIAVYRFTEVYKYAKDYEKVVHYA